MLTITNGRIRELYFVPFFIPFLLLTEERLKCHKNTRERVTVQTDKMIAENSCPLLCDL